MPSDTLPRPGFKVRARHDLSPGNEALVEQILVAALTVLVEEGASAFSLRRVAARCEIRCGHLSYYFPKKQDLVRELLEALMIGYREVAEASLPQTPMSPEDRLAWLVSFTLNDIRSRQTTNLFTELWAMANHDPLVADRLHRFYVLTMEPVAEAIHALNRGLSIEQSRKVAMFVTGTLEGMTIFCGHGKPWEADMTMVERLAIRSMVDLARDVTPDELRAIES